MTCTGDWKAMNFFQWISVNVHVLYQEHMSRPYNQEHMSRPLGGSYAPDYTVHLNCALIIIKFCLLIIIWFTCMVSGYVTG